MASVSLRPVAEETGLIVPLGEWIIHEACERAARWTTEGLRPLHVAVNLSAVQFRNPSLDGMIQRIVGETRIDPARLELEITESLLTEDLHRAVTLLSELKSSGFEIWIDDFGTGYSSLSYLKQLPITGLKIDQSFVRDMDKDAEDASIVSAVIALAKNLSLDVVAEGVETGDHRHLLEQQACHYAQGYFYSRPLTDREFIRWAKDWEQAELGAAAG